MFYSLGLSFKFNKRVLAHALIYDQDFTEALRKKKTYSDQWTKKILQEREMGLRVVVGETAYWTDEPEGLVTHGLL